MAVDTLNPRSWLYPTPRGLYCKPGDFYVDPTVAVPRAVITHGHGDHARPGHRSALATPETLAIMRARFEDLPDTDQQPLKYGESVRVGEVDVRFAPAGHILGSAQAVLAYRGQRIVVSGDFKRRPAPPRPPRPSSRCPATSSSPRRHSPCRCSIIPPMPARSASFCAPSPPFPNALIWWASTRSASASA